MAGAFARQSPPRSRLLAHYGEGFAEFIERFEPARLVPYLADMARLELARVQACFVEPQLDFATPAAAPVSRSGVPGQSRPNTVTLTNASNFTTSANITGAGKLALLGTGVVTLTGNLSGLNGNLTVNAGSTLNVGDGGTTGILSANVDNNGTVNVNRSDNVTIASVLMGTGLINKLGSNVLTLAGNSTFSGNISVRAGTLKSGDRKSVV